MKAFLLILLGLASLPACAGSSPLTDGPPAPPLGVWQVVAIEGQPTVGDQIWIRFDREHGAVGSGGINRFSGSWKAGPFGWSVGPLAVTQMAGPAPAMQQEGAFLAALDAVRKARPAADGAVELLDQDDQPRLRLIALGDEAASAQLQGTASYRERIALLPGHRLVVQLQDVSRADAPAQVLAEREQAVVGNVPIAWSLWYDPAQIHERRRYTVRAQLLAPDGSLAWTTTEAIPAFEADGQPRRELMLPLQRVGRGGN